MAPVSESPYPAVDIPHTDIWGLLFEREPDFPIDKPIFVDSVTSRQYTYTDVKETSIAFGDALRAHWKWQKGDVLSIFSPNCIDTPALTWGALYGNGIVSPANPAYSVDEYAFQLKDSGAKAVLTHGTRLQVAIEAAKRVGIPSSRILLMGDERDAGATHFTDFLNSARGGKSVPRKPNDPKDLAFLVYSSGTTGLPKGVMLTHRNMVAQMLMITVGQYELSSKGGPDGTGDKILAVLPFYHIYGLAVLIHHPLYNGITTVVMSQFALDAFCQTIHNRKITYLYVAPPIVLALGKEPSVDKYDLSSVRMIVSGAAPLTRDLVEAVWKRLKLPCKQAYGLSETSPATHIQRFSEWQTAIGSVGVLLPNQTAMYMSETGQPVAPGTPGELWVRGPNVFAGYLNNEKATAACLTPDGFFKTGDVGHVDEAGNFYITDRVKELIKYKGFQVPPAELEGLLLGHQAVADVCVLGVYDEEQATEVPRAYVVRSTAALKLEEGRLSGDIRTFMDTKVAKHKKLRGGVVFVDEIPKTASGKILRRVLKARMALPEKGSEVKAKL